jgi:hypothetical protein
MSVEGKAQPAVRLVFQYDGDQVELLSQSPVTMVVPRTDPGQAAPGVYVDSRSADGAPLARVRAHKAMAASTEIFPSRPEHRLRHIARPQRGAFSVVVPMSEDADHVAVVGIAPGSVPAAAADLAQFPLHRG